MTLPPDHGEPRSLTYPILAMAWDMGLTRIRLSGVNLYP